MNLPTMHKFAVCDATGSIGASLNLKVPLETSRPCFRRSRQPLLLEKGAHLLEQVFGTSKLDHPAQSSLRAPKSENWPSSIGLNEIGGVPNHSPSVAGHRYDKEPTYTLASG